MSKLIKKLIEEHIEVDQLVMRVNEYSIKFNRCKDPESLIEALKEKGLLEITAVMIANIYPKSLDELRALMNFESKTYDDSELEEILNIIDEKCKLE